MINIKFSPEQVANKFKQRKFILVPEFKVCLLSQEPVSTAPELSSESQALTGTARSASPGRSSARGSKDLSRV